MPTQNTYEWVGSPNQSVNIKLNIGLNWKQKMIIGGLVSFSPEGLLKNQVMPPDLSIVYSPAGASIKTLEDYKDLCLINTKSQAAKFELISLKQITAGKIPAYSLMYADTYKDLRMRFLQTIMVVGDHFFNLIYRADDKEFDTYLPDVEAAIQTVTVNALEAKRDDSIEDLSKVVQQTMSEVLAALNNQDFAKIYALTSDSFKKDISLEALQRRFDIFKGLEDIYKKIDPASMVFDQAPVVTPENLMFAQVHYQISQSTFSFQLRYSYIENSWKLDLFFPGVKSSEQKPPEKIGFAT